MIQRPAALPNRLPMRRQRVRDLHDRQFVLRLLLIAALLVRRCGVDSPDITALFQRLGRRRQLLGILAKQQLLERRILGLSFSASSFGRSCTHMSTSLR